MTAPRPTELDPATERALAADLFNQTWRLLELPHRTMDQDDEMVHAAHASWYHWGRVGGAANIATGEWQCARVYDTLGRPEPALHHAGRCLAVCEANGLVDFHIAAAYEGMARAHATAGDLAAARGWKAARPPRSMGSRKRMTGRSSPGTSPRFRSITDTLGGNPPAPGGLSP